MFLEKITAKSFFKYVLLWIGVIFCNNISATANESNKLFIENNIVATFNFLESNLALNHMTSIKRVPFRGTRFDLKFASCFQGRMKIEF